MAVIIECLILKKEQFSKKNETADNKISKYRELQETKNEYVNDAIFKNNRLIGNTIGQNVANL